MQMRGEQRIAATRERVWDALNDPEILRQCIPGCRSLEREEDGRLRAVAEVKIGPIGARFNGVVTLSELDPPNGYTITGEGQGGTVGSAKGGAKVRLAADGSGTLLSYDVDAQVGGRLAQLGGALIDATAKQMAGQFFRKFGAIVEAPPGTVPVLKEGPSVAPRASAPVGRPSTLWIVGLVVAGLLGFLLGRVTAPPSVVLDKELMSRLLESQRQ